MSSAIFYC